VSLIYVELHVFTNLELDGNHEGINYKVTMLRETRLRVVKLMMMENGSNEDTANGIAYVESEDKRVIGMEWFGHWCNID
jgi:hypothetical protein